MFTKCLSVVFKKDIKNMSRQIEVKKKLLKAKEIKKKKNMKSENKKHYRTNILKSHCSVGMTSVQKLTSIYFLKS